MAYILGYIFADGSLEDASYLRGKYLRITSCDISILQTIRRAFESEHKIIKLPPSTANGKYRYFLRIGDHNIYGDLINLGLTPRKSLTMIFPKCIPSNFMGDFIRGYFDGDGTFYCEKTKNRIIPRTVFTSGSKRFLESLSEVIASSCHLQRVKKVYNSHRSYQLVYKSKEAMELMDFMFRPASDKSFCFLDRKYKLYSNYKSALS
ncbi:MAG: LAGLIDADG family homing endonuclease [Candidatus Omnitrophica bacterium]|nr:LAGLIDADG family homing endonuclease [Candidatus Omnitrophota bacterium]